MKFSLLVLPTVLLLHPAGAPAHCDGLDGPVVAAARRALETGDVSHALIWVRKDDEAAIRTAFTQTLVVRKLGPEAQQLADHYFFETLVRIHRAGEGAPYTGLKPAGRDLGPAMPAADEAVAHGKLEALAKLLSESVHSGLRERFHQVAARKGFEPGDVEAGRQYVQAYVEFVHYVEGVYSAARGPVSHDRETTAHQH